MRPHPILKAACTVSDESSTAQDSNDPALPFAHWRFAPPVQAQAQQARNRNHPRVDILQTPHVHFPPTPDIITSSQRAASYDRAPIRVSPNVCDMPERGERVYMGAGSSPKWGFRSGSSKAAAVASPKRSYFHPRAFEACELEGEEGLGSAYNHRGGAQDLDSPPTSPPELIPDLSSSSPESSSSCLSSDDLDSPPHIAPTPTSLFPTFNLNTVPSSKAGVGKGDSSVPAIPLPIPFARTSSREEFDRALTFLPHPPTPRPRKLSNGRRTPPPSLQLTSGKYAGGVRVVDPPSCLDGF